MLNKYCVSLVMAVGILVMSHVSLAEERRSMRMHSVEKDPTMQQYSNKDRDNAVSLGRAKKVPFDELSDSAATKQLKFLDVDGDGKLSRAEVGAYKKKLESGEQFKKMDAPRIPEETLKKIQSGVSGKGTDINDVLKDIREN